MTRIIHDQTKTESRNAGDASLWGCGCSRPTPVRDDHGQDFAERFSSLFDDLPVNWPGAIANNGCRAFSHSIALDVSPQTGVVEHRRAGLVHSRRHGRPAVKFSRRLSQARRAHSFNLAHQPSRQAIADVSSSHIVEPHSSFAQSRTDRSERNVGSAQNIVGEIQHDDCR